MDWGLLGAVFVITAGAVCSGLFPVRAYLVKRAILDHPNERSSHVVPTPRGGGLVVIPVLLIALAGLYYGLPHAVPPATGGMVLLAGGLAAFSWIDDLRGIPALARLATHGVVVAAALNILSADALYFQGLFPPALDHIAAGIAWVWFLNLYNFMDGIDGISGVQATAIGAGILAVGILASSPEATQLAPIGVACAGAALGFLCWNWPPSRIFLGDVGSTGLGFLLGWVLLSLAAEGFWHAALILPAYYLADATLTLLKRAFRREKIWRAHRSHFYQRAVQAGASHGMVSTGVAAANLLLIGCAAIAVMGHIIAALVAAVVIVAVFLYILDRGKLPQQKLETVGPEAPSQDMRSPTSHDERLSTSQDERPTA